MTSGLLIILILLTSPVAAAEPTDASPLDPERILAGLDLGSERVEFTESRTSSLLREPLLVEGVLHRDENGNQLIRETRSPSEETQILGEDFVELRRANGHRRRFSLDRAPELAALRTVLLALLDGEAARLGDAFELQATGGESEGWTLALQPRAEALAERVERLVLQGQASRLDSLTLVLGDGEEILTRFDPSP